MSYLFVSGVSVMCAIKSRSRTARPSLPLEHIFLLNSFRRRFLFLCEQGRAEARRHVFLHKNRFVK